jgi:hypothetical protein
LCTVARITSAVAVIVSTRADEPLSAATNRSEVPATPLSLRLGAPVSQRYRDLEDALVGEIDDSWRL